MKFLKKYLLFGLAMVVAQQSFSQLYTTNLYGVRKSATNVVYGAGVNFAGFTDTLKLDIYTPIGDNNCHRPLFVMIHGGAWVSGDKQEGSVVATLSEMVKKGYAAISINYRMGTHKAAYYVPYALCNGNTFPVCAQIADTAEVLRANFRAMQDARGAIRFMKNRAILDSVDINNVFVGGESAGGFVAMAVAYMNKANERPVTCGAIANAPTPDSDLISCLPSGYNLARPDLGDINGYLHTGTHDATVRGVGNFFGGVFDTAIIRDVNAPVIYQFYQTTDVIVSPYYMRLLNRLSYDCLYNICQPYYTYPSAFGAASIESYLTAINTAAPVHNTDGVGTSNGNADCLISPPGHSVDNNVLRAQNMANVFAPAIYNNTPGCGGVGVASYTLNNKLICYPSVFMDDELITIASRDMLLPQNIKVWDIQGRDITPDGISIDGNTATFYLNNAAVGMYVVSVMTKTGCQQNKIIKLK